MGMGYSDRLFDSQVEIDLEATKKGRCCIFY